MRFRGKEAYVKDVSLRTGTWYKADGMVKLAQHSEGRSSVPEVNHGVVHRNNVFLPGEVSVRGLNGFKATRTVQASVAAMVQTPQTEKSAEGIVTRIPPSREVRQDSIATSAFFWCTGTRPWRLFR